jgi:hypothetical protein
LIGKINDGRDICGVLFVALFFGGEQRDAQPDAGNQQDDNGNLNFHNCSKLADPAVFCKSGYLPISGAAGAAAAAS